MVRVAFAYKPKKTVFYSRASFFFINCCSVVASVVLPQFVQISTVKFFFLNSKPLMHSHLDHIRYRAASAI